MPRGRPGTNYCKDCKWSPAVESVGEEFIKCLNPKITPINPSTGKLDWHYCSTQRKNWFGWTRFIFFEKECGPPGRYWEPKE